MTRQQILPVVTWLICSSSYKVLFWICWEKIGLHVDVSHISSFMYSIYKKNWDILLPRSSSVSPLSKRLAAPQSRALSPFSQKMAPSGAVGGMHLPHSYAASGQLGNSLIDWVLFWTNGNLTINLLFLQWEWTLRKVTTAYWTDPTMVLCLEVTFPVNWARLDNLNVLCLFC